MWEILSFSKRWAREAGNALGAGPGGEATAAADADGTEGGTTSWEGMGMDGEGETSERGREAGMEGAERVEGAEGGM